MAAILRGRMSSKTSSLRRGALAVAATLALLLFNHLDQRNIVLVCLAIGVLLFYGLSGWIIKSKLGFAGKLGRSTALLLFCSSAAGLIGWYFWPSWHLTNTQENGLAALAREIPKNIVVVVELPSDSELGEEYGTDIMRVLHDSGTSVNQVRVYRGVGETPVGVIVATRNISDPAYRPALMLQAGMFQLRIPAKFRDGDALADDGSIVIYVGSKPEYQ